MEQRKSAVEDMERLNIYNNKRILVTGHTGFKGSWLTLWLLELGAEVTGYALPPSTKPDLFGTLNLSKRINHITGDIRDFTKLKKSIKRHKPDAVIHMAAQPLVRRSYLEPKYTYEVNVLGTVNVLDAVRQTNTVRAVINVTSDKCYENKEQVAGYKETDPMGGYDPYSSSKGCAELVTAAYIKSFFNPDKYKSHGVAVASVRAGNVVGGGDWSKDRLIPDCIRALTKNKPIVIRNPYAIRPWQYVLEPLYGYLLLGSHLLKEETKYIGAWNFGPNKSNIVPVETVVKKIINVWGKGNYRIIPDKKLHEATLLNLDIAKSKALLKWQPRMNIADTLENTINWYKAFYSGSINMLPETLGQIRGYYGK
ncbi:MAG: CDP-glucose 4,6-dehydratase [Planctomycetota bacterium]